MKSDYISRSALSKRLTFLAMNGAAGHQRAYAKCVNEVETAPNGQMWINTKRGLPEKASGEVLVIVNGVYKKVRFQNAVQLAEYDEDEGWIIEGYEEWENPQIDWWMPLPEMPEEEI